MKNNKLDFIVIGAGIAGLTVAYELKRKNKSVLVLEQNNNPGGRMAALTIDKVSLSLGAQFAASFYSNMNSYLEEFNLKKEKLSLSRVAIKKSGRFHCFNGENPLSLLYFSGLVFIDKFRLLFVLILKIFEARGIDVYDLKTYEAFDDRTVYDDLIKIVGQESFDYFIDPMLGAIFGYSSKVFSKAMFLAVLSKFLHLHLYSFKGGINELALEFAKRIDIKFDTKVISVEKTDREVIIKGVSNKKEVIYRADKVVIALPGNQVLKILVNPSKEEYDFFKQVKYSRLGYVFFKSKQLIFPKIDIVWFPYKENKYFASVAVIKKIKEEYYYSAELREDIDESNLEKAIRQQIGVNEFKIIYKHFWQSAVPKFIPGYLKSVIRFKESIKKNNSIFFCGDYLEVPSTEGALTSGLKIAQLLNN